jgi:hypothetical protein
MKNIVLMFFPPALAGLDVIPGFDWGTISATGLLGWYLWYTTKVVFPRHQDHVAEMQEGFTKQFNIQRDHYERILDDVQERQDNRHEQIVESLEKISQCLDKK